MTPLAKGLIIFVLEFLFILLKTLNTRYIIRRSLRGSLITSFLVSTTWLATVAIGVGSILNGDYIIVPLGYTLGALLGTYVGVRLKLK